jgi:hypothetical protein
VVWCQQSANWTMYFWGLSYRWHLCQDIFTHELLHLLDIPLTAQLHVCYSLTGCFHISIDKWCSVLTISILIIRVATEITGTQSIRFLSVGHMKAMVYEQKMETRDELLYHVICAARCRNCLKFLLWYTFRSNLSQNVMQPEGGHFEHLL